VTAFAGCDRRMRNHHPSLTCSRTLRICAEILLRVTNGQKTQWPLHDAFVARDKKALSGRRAQRRDKGPSGGLCPKNLSNGARRSEGWFST